MSGNTGPTPQQSRSDGDFWMIYVNKLKETFFPGAEMGEMNRIYIPPLNQQAIPAGPTIKSAVTNYGISKVGDGLIQPGNPLLTFSGETYAQKCLRYLRNVQLGGVSDLGLKIVAEQRLADVNKKQEAYDAKLAAAETRFNNRTVKDPNDSVESWAVDNFPALQSARDDLDGALLDYDTVQTQIYGPGYQSLQTDKARVAAACNPASPSIYNMQVQPALIGAADFKEGPPQYAPLYTIGTGSEYPTDVYQWIANASDRNPPQTRISFSSADASNYSWESVGFTSTSVRGGASWFPFFSVNYSADGTDTSDVLHLDSQSTNVKFEISAVKTQSYPIGPSNSWLPQDVKKQYPTLFEIASKDLWDPMFRIQQIVVGYKVSIKITMDKSTYQQVTSKLTQAREKSGQASASFFGCLINIGGSANYKEQSSTNYDDVKRNDDEYSLVIPGNNNGFPVLLAALGTQVGGKSQTA